MICATSWLGNARDAEKKEAVSDLAGARRQKGLDKISPKRAKSTRVRPLLAGELLYQLAK